MNSPEEARREVLAQEFFRLIIPHQPETLLAINPSTESRYILSEEIRGYRMLPKGRAGQFVDGVYTGLGQAVMSAMFLQEIDLKNGNIGLDEHNRVIKIDGDRCFASRRPSYAKSSFIMTPASIASLPSPKDFDTFNWLDYRKMGVSQITSDIVSPELSHAAHFRSEVNQAIFKICMLPDQFIDLFVNTHIVDPKTREEYTALIKSRRNELKTSALKNEHFLEYLQTSNAVVDQEALLAHMMTFTADGSSMLSDEYARASIAMKLQENAANLRMYRCQKLLQKIACLSG